MVFGKGDLTIIIEHQPVFGKRPELYIGEGNQLLKVACFGSDEKAEKFEEFLRFFFGDNLRKEEKMSNTMPDTEAVQSMLRHHILPDNDDLERLASLYLEELERQKQTARETEAGKE